MPSANALTTVQKLYIAYYGRAADAAGQDYWAVELDKAGGALNGIIDAFANAEEAKALYGSGTTAVDRITVLYQNILGRAPEPAGLAYWAGEVAAGRLSLGNTALAILEGVQSDSTDAPLANNRLSVANSFTAQVSSAPQNYAGDAAAAIARTFLKQVTGDAASVTQANTQLGAYLNTMGVASQQPQNFAALISNGMLTNTAIVSATLTNGNMEARIQALVPSAIGAEDAAGIGITLSGSEVNDVVTSFVIKSLPANGTLKMGEKVLSVGSVVDASYSAAVLTFVPKANFNGTTSFSFAAKNSAGQEDATPATATITVTPVNDAPVGVADTLSATTGVAVTYTAAQLLGNDTDVDGDTLTLKSVTAGAGGTVVLNANGTVTFTPAADFSGQASFAYVATDGFGGDSAATAVTVNVAVGGSQKAPWTLLMHGGSSHGASIPPNSGIFTSDGSADGTGLNVIEGWGWYWMGASNVRFKTTDDHGKVFFYNILQSGSDGERMGSVGIADGTASGTKVLMTAANNSYLPGNYVAVAGSQLIMAGGDQYPNYAGKILVSDGTVAGTTLHATDFVVPSNPDVIDPAHQTLWFAASTRPYGTELVQFSYTAGSTPFTKIVKDIYPGSSDGVSSAYSPLRGALLLDGKLVFGADDGVHGYEPWVSDGTEAGTFMLVNLEGSKYGSGSSSFTAFGLKVAFAANVTVHGSELAFTDGTVAGTTVLDVNPDGDSYPTILGQVNDLLYFTAETGDYSLRSKGIYSTDGTTFTRLADINSSASLLGWNTSKAFFKVSDTAHGAELWAADLTATGGFALVKDILPGSGSALAEVYETKPVMVGDKLIFNAYTSATQQNLFMSDGTNAGTLQLSSSLPTMSKVVGDTLVFATQDGVYGVNTATAIPSAQKLVSGASTGSSGDLFGTYPAASLMQTDADQVFFKTSNGDLYATNGSASDTIKLAGAVENFKVVAENALFFVQHSNTVDAALWYSDGTSAGTRFVEALPADFSYDLDNAVAIKTVGVAF